METKKTIGLLIPDQQFKLSAKSATFVVVKHESGRTGYRHLITDFPHKVHHWLKSDAEVFAVN
jgi:hypothetical protein